VDAIRAHVELHIEQGNLLEVKDINLGIVTSIRAPKKYRIVLRGEFDHSGATPMGKNYRRDVNLAMAYIQVELDKRCTQYLSDGLDLVQTVGVINSNPDFSQANPAILSNAITVISGFGYFSYEVRSCKRETLELVSSEAEKIIQNVAKDFGVSAEIKLLSPGKPLEKLDPDIQNVMEASAASLGFSAMRMPSGAGHDAAIVGEQKKSDGSAVPVGMLFIPCRGGKSHCPEEFASSEDISKGASVLASGLERLAND
jgi:N-carbamoyl-L-amino-acid hydrolase